MTYTYEPTPSLSGARRYSERQATDTIRASVPPAVNPSILPGGRLVRVRYCL